MSYSRKIFSCVRFCKLWNFSLLTFTLPSFTILLVSAFILSWILNLNNGLFWYLHVCFVHLSNRLSCRSETWLVLCRPCYFSFVLSVSKGWKMTKGLFTRSGGPRSSGVGFFCFHAPGDTKQKKLTLLDRGPPLHVNRV